MELDSQLLQDLMEFLQTLENSTLPAKVEALRVRLVGRMRLALLSSVHYMDMQSGKPIKDSTVSDNSSEEYVIPDQRPLPTKSSLYPQQPKKPDKVEEKLNLLLRKSPNPSPIPPSIPIVLPPPIDATEEDQEILEELEPLDPVVDVYNTMNLIKAQSKAHHFGQLQRREKWFLFETIRPFWAALVGWHLLSFDNKTDVKPSQILSIKGCLCRPVASSPKNSKKLSDSTFELCYGKNKSVQFIASTPKEMQQWMAAITRCEIKAKDANHLLAVRNATLPPPPPISEDELSSEEQDQNEEYIEVDLVIDNLAEALANPPKIFRPNKPKPSAVNPPKPAASPIYPKRIVNRVLPPPPPVKRDSEQDEDVYQIIEENNHNQPCTSINSNSKIGQRESSTSTDSNGVLYDDLDNVIKEVKEIEEKNIRKEAERNIPVQESAEDDITYDDVNVVRMEVEEIRRTENAAKESPPEIDKEKKTPKELPTKSSPMKNFFGIFRQKNESPQEEGAKRKPVISAPQRPDKKPVSIELSIAQNSSVAPETHSNSQILQDLSDYNSLPHPRPVDDETPVSNGGDDEEEAIYDDICNRNYVFNNHTVSSKKDENIATKNNPVRTEGYPTPMTNGHRNVVRNLNEKFKNEIYQNQTGDSNGVDDDLELYKVPRPDANAHRHIPVEDDDTEKIYDDVAIVAQKKREIVQAKEKPAVVSKPKFNRGPAVLAKPFEKNFLNKLNKFTSTAAEKSAIEKNNQHRFSPGKKSKPQEAIINFKKHQIMSADEQIYDDCQATKG